MSFSRHLRLAFAQFRSNRAFTLINIAGLSAGIATCLLIVLFVKDETSYDQYNKNAERIYRVSSHVRLNGNENKYATSEKPLKDALAAVPGIQASARLIPASGLFLSPKKYFVELNGNKVEEPSWVFAESDLFKLFTLPAVYGTTAHSLDQPFSAVITKRAAEKYFNRDDVVGETLQINDSLQYKVSAVIENVPATSHFHYDLFLSYASLPEYEINEWGYNGIHNYVLLQPGTDPKRVAGDIEKLTQQNYPDALTQSDNFLKVELTGLTQIHLHSDAKYELEPGGNGRVVNLLSLIAALILLVACVNFINLSTARSVRRAAEIAVRKVLGAPRASLLWQLLTETLLLSFLASLLSVFYVLLAIPWLNQLTDKQITLQGSTLFSFIAFLIGLILLVGLIAGLIPALRLSAFKPLAVMKTSKTSNSGNNWFQHALIVFQFAVSVFLITASFAIYKQMKYIYEKDLGFDRQQVVLINSASGIGKRASLLRDELSKIPSVKMASLGMYFPTGREKHITGLFPSVPVDVKDVVLTDYWPADGNYLSTMGMTLITGRSFSSNFGSDSSAIIVNEAFLRKMNIKDPINATVYRNSGPLEALHIIGVVKDFNFSSLHNQVTPLAFYFENQSGAVAAKLGNGNLPDQLHAIQATWTKLVPNQSFDYSFLDADFEKTYRAEQRIQTIFIYFSALAIAIACLGLLGLAAFAAENRRKEMAIRKVIGAGTFRLTALLTSAFLKLVLIAILLAIPIAWFFTHKWLEDFAYRVEIGWWVFAAGSLLALLLAVLTVGTQAIRSALANPIRNLRSE